VEHTAGLRACADELRLAVEPATCLALEKQSLDSPQSTQRGLMAASKIPDSRFQGKSLQAEKKFGKSSTEFTENSSPVCLCALRALRGEWLFVRLPRHLLAG